MFMSNVSKTLNGGEILLARIMHFNPERFQFTDHKMTDHKVQYKACKATC